MIAIALTQVSQNVLGQVLVDRVLTVIVAKLPEAVFILGKLVEHGGYSFSISSGRIFLIAARNSGTRRVAMAHMASCSTSPYS